MTKKEASMTENLPSDFAETLKTIEQRGIEKEGLDQIHERLIASVEGPGALLGASEVKLGVRDWASSFVREAKAAIHKEICDSEKKQLKEEYLQVFKGTLTTQGITSVASALTSIVSAIHPALAVSTVLAFLAIWILKVGANQWCSYPKPE